MDGQFWVDERERTSPVENRPGRDRPKCDTTTDKHDPPSLACGIPRCGEAVDAPGRRREKKLPSTRRATRAAADEKGGRGKLHAPKHDGRTDETNDRTKETTTTPLSGQTERHDRDARRAASPDRPNWPALQSQSFSRGYRSNLPTSLNYIILETRD